MSRRPNILLLMTDEERERAWFPDHVRLPNRERLAARGMSFRNHHVHTFPCTPSRSTIMTGRHAATTAMFDNVNFNWQGPLDPSIPTIGTMLGDAGYHAGYVGKWHLGGETRADGLLPYGFSDWRPPDTHGTPYLGHLVDGHTANRAARFLTDHAADDDPWFLVCSFVNPHDIMLYPRFRKPRVRDHGVELPPNFDDDLSTKPVTQSNWRITCDVTAGAVRSHDQWRMLINAYIDLQQEVDRHLGTVLDALATTGAQDDTLVVFTSDHGDMAGAHGLRQKGAFLYRENAQVPLTMVWPGTIPPGTESHRLTGAVDLATTLCEVGGVPADITADTMGELPPLPGADLTPLWVDPSRAVRNELLVTSDAFSSIGPVGPHRGFLRGIITERWKFGRYVEPGRQAAPLAECDVELYDRDADPLELTNRAGDPAHAGTVAELDDALSALIAREVGQDDVDLPAPRTRLAHLNRLVVRRARRAA